MVIVFLIFFLLEEQCLRLTNSQIESEAQYQPKEDEIPGLEYSFANKFNRSLETNHESISAHWIKSPTETGRRSTVCWGKYLYRDTITWMEI